MVIRFIYTYKERTSGRPVYVGSTLDTKTRQRIRVYRLCCPFDRELAAHPEKYEHSILEVFKTNTDEESRRLCVLRENQWMDVLDTYRTSHGFNFQRANIPFNDRESWLIARQKAQTTPEALAQKSTSCKASWTPELRRRQSSLMKRLGLNPVTRKRHSNAAKYAWQSEYRESMKRVYDFRRYYGA